MKTCLIIPVYNHEHAIARVLERLQPYRLPCLLVNDGSSPACTQLLNTCASDQADWVSLLNRPVNGGKGAAVIDGFRAALAQGFTHALQIDADGQHDPGDVPRFLAAAEQQPQAMILGKPVFDDSVPKSRLHGRKITNFWIAINTLSLTIADGMCGFRLYPLAAVERLLNSTGIGQGMDFDIDIVVRLYWQGVQPVNLETKVSYPYDGVSHFKLWRDNVLISKCHARLFFGLLPRAPGLLSRRWR